MTCIYYGSQMQFLNTIIGLVKMSSLPRETGLRRSEHIGLLVLWGGQRMVGKAMSGHVSPDGAHTILMEYLSWKYST